MEAVKWDVITMALQLKSIAGGNHDLVGNYVPLFFINDKTDSAALFHAVKFEANTGFPTGALGLRYLLYPSFQ